MLGNQDIKKYVRGDLVTKEILIDKLNNAIDEARKEHYKLFKINAQSALMWEGVRLGLQDAIQIIEGQTPKWLREIKI